MRLQQEAQLNAPDPRDTHPPCYEDAIRMPKPFFYSMDELSTTRKQKQRKRRLLKQTSEDSGDVAENSRPSQFHSEQVKISIRFSNNLLKNLFYRLSVLHECLHDFIRLS